jgi:hypothetical protein
LDFLELIKKFSVSSQTLHSLVDIARLAPSVHNTQPWRVRAENSSVIVSLDRGHMLSDGDPTGRQTTISLGIFAEAICIAAESLSLAVQSVKLQDMSVVIELGSAENTKLNSDAVDLLRKRCSDRSIYTSSPLSKETTRTIESIKRNPEVNIAIITDPAKIKVIAGLTSQGIRLALSSPRFRRELSRYLTLPWSKKTRGIAVKSLYIPRLIEIMQPLFMRLGIGMDKEANVEKARWLSASGVIILTSAGDLHSHWFEIGRTYLRVSIAVEKLGLSQATSAAIVEASNFHEDIEEMLDTKQRVQALIRIGKGSKKRHYSPRVTAAELITT